jgi:hypothetical protein
MPPHLTVADYRLKSIADYLPPALGLLDELGDAFGGSFVQLSSQVTLSLITAVQVSNGFDDCQW